MLKLRDRTEKKKMEMDLLESYRKVHEARTATILGLAKLAEYRDEGTGTHLERIREYALTEEEFEIIKRHTLMGGNALKAIESQIEGKSFLAMGKEIAYNHHEKWDGSGYPRGLKGEAIPLSARIIAVADVYDALTTKRFYKEAYSHAKARDMILQLKGKHFDPEMVNAFAAVADKFNQVRKEKLKEEADFSQQPARAVGR
jgi:response regulator RpfG family c-di-GMP phosphodiesterase